MSLVPTLEQLEDRALFAIPKKGRLYDKCLQLLKDIDIKFRRSARLDVALSTTLPIALVFLPAADIAKFVAKGRVDLGITGRDIVEESRASSTVHVMQELGFGKCRLCVQAPRNGPVKSVQDLAGKRVVTSFVHLATNYFQEQGVADVQVSYVSGSVEVACTLGLADAVVDLVESGETMMAAGLQVIDTIMHTESLLVANPNSRHQPLVDQVSQRVLGVLTASNYVMAEYNVPRSLLPEATKITPGRRAPTVSTLENGEWVAVKAMVKESEKHDVMDKLHILGATDILITLIHNCRA